VKCGGFCCIERPALLFEVRCADHDISLGGSPLRYIISPYNARGQFHVYLLETQTLVSDWSLPLQGCAFDGKNEMILQLLSDTSP